MRKNKVKVSYEEENPNKRKRKYSPENNKDVTQRILQYFEDPNEADALSKIKRISNRAKKSSKNIRDGVDFSEFVNVKLVSNDKEPFERRKRQFATTKYVPKNKNMNLMDELNERMMKKKKKKKKKK